MRFSSADRQRIINEYLAATGANMFVPPEFVDWLGGQPNHEAYDWFYSKDDSELAREHRIAMARRMANGLRVTASVSSVTVSNVVSVGVREFPAFLSHFGGRKYGGGYQPFNPRDDASVSELRAQGARALRTWLDRYRGVADMTGVSVAHIEEIAVLLEGRVVLSA